MKTLSAIIVLITALGAGPLQAQQILDEIAARVNGGIILRSDIEKKRLELLKELNASDLKGPEYDRVLAEESKNLLRDLIDKTLLLQVAKEHGMDASADVVKIMETMRQKYRAQLLQDYKSDSIEALEKLIREQGDDPEEFKEFLRDRELTRQVIQREVYSKVVITNEDTRTYYDAHRKDFERPAGVQLSIIVVGLKTKSGERLSGEKLAAQRTKIDTALEALKRGDKFPEVAQLHSEDESASDGGIFGFVEKEDLEKNLDAEVAQAIGKLKKGEFSNVVELSETLVIVRLDDRHDGGILSYELATGEAWQRVMSERTPDKTREYLIKLRREGFIKVTDGYFDSGSLRDTAVAATPKTGKN